MIHVPVLLKEIIQYLDPRPNENFVDCTIGSGGHAFEILKYTEPNGKLLGIDWDAAAIQNLDQKIKVKDEKNKERIILVHDNYVNLKNIILKYNFLNIHGILADLGFSLDQIEQSGRGFSFMRDEPLDMRYNQDGGLTAKEIINNWLQEDIEKILENYGEERFAKRIAENIIQERKFVPIETTLQLVEIIRNSVSAPYRYEKIHFATRTFQALRIMVNNELINLEKFLPQAIEVLNKNGRLGIISFHSIEDRIVKKFFKEKSQENILEKLTKKPIFPSEEEILKNRKSRSAKLRVIKKII